MTTSMIVVGGGMAGLMLAAGVERAGTLRCMVLEQARSLDEVGAGVQLSPRSVHLLREVGALSDLLEQAVAVQAREVRSWQGQVISRTELGQECEQRYGAPYLAVHRADLQWALLERVQQQSVLLGVPVADAWSTSLAAGVRTASGQEYEASAVIGADGIRSVVRSALVPGRAVHSGLVAYRALVNAGSLPPSAREPVVRIWVGPGSHAVTYPIRGGELINLVAVIPGSPGRESWTVQGSVDELLLAYLGWDDLLGAVLSQVQASTVWALHDRDVVHQLAFGRIALVGDAAHPMLPFAAQGVNQGLEDAWVLAEALRHRGTDTASALSGYSAVRAPAAAKAQVASRHLAVSLHVPDGADRAARDARVVADSALAQQDPLLAPIGWPRPS